MARTPGPSLAEKRLWFLKGALWSLIAFAVFSLWTWRLMMGSWPAFGWSFVAPLVSAVECTRRGDVDMAVVSWAVTLSVAAFVTMGTLRPGRHFTWLVHVALAAYWIWSFALVGIGA